MSQPIEPNAHIVQKEIVYRRARSHSNNQKKKTFHFHGHSLSQINWTYIKSLTYSPVCTCVRTTYVCACVCEFDVQAEPITLLPRIMPWCIIWMDGCGYRSMSLHYIKSGTTWIYVSGHHHHHFRFATSFHICMCRAGSRIRLVSVW